MAMWQRARASCGGFCQEVSASWAARPIYRVLLIIVICLTVCGALFFSFETWLDKITVDWGPTALLVLWTAIGTVTGGAVHFVYTTVLEWAGWQRSTSTPGPEAQTRDSLELASQFFAVVGVIYAVLVAFVVVTAWQARSNADDLTIQEQHNVDYLFHLNEPYPSEQAETIRYLLRDYAVNTLAEWAQMARETPLCRDISESDISCFESVGAVSNQANLIAHCIGDLTISLPSYPLNPRYNTSGRKLKTWQLQELYQQDLTILEGISENRQERRARYNERTLQPILWVAFLLGALLLSGMSYFVSGQRAREQLVRTCALFGMVGMMTAIALVFDRPLAGTTQINGSGWTRLIRHFDHDLTEDAKQKKSLAPGYFERNCESGSPASQ